MRAARVTGEVSLSLVGDREILELNREFAGEDHATDVLSFEQDSPGSLLMGDIVISVEWAARQARQPLADELLHLAVHGLAHLCGYDHATRAEERVMFGWETKLREQARGRAPVKTIARPSRRE
jgi:probable rRNA maturation factor